MFATKSSKRTKKAKVRAATTPKPPQTKAHRVRINEGLPGDPTYMVEAKDGEEALIKAIARFKADHPSTPVRNIDVVVSTTYDHIIG